MNKVLYTLSFLFVGLLMSTNVEAGNPDRQGEAGASELLLNPWARSAGVHSMSTASVMGVEAMRLNVAGLSRINSSELLISNTRLYEGTGMAFNAIGYATKLGSNGTLGISLAALDFGDIPITTTTQPEGTGGTFSPSFFHMGLGYAYMYENKISVGILFRGISESLQDISAFGLAIDAGVQYVSGPQDNFRLGISLRNSGSPMEFGGDGLSFQTQNPDNPGTTFNLTVDERSEDFELPSLLNIGLSYDFYFGEKNFLRAITNFTSNAFSSDQIGAGAEFSFKDLVVLRGAYKLDIEADSEKANVYTGLAGGVSVNVPLKKGSQRKVGLDYAYRSTNPFRGTHNFSIRLSL